MNNALVILVALFIGYIFGWYQFSYSVEDVPIVEQAQHSIPATEVVSENANAEQLGINQALAQIDETAISNAVDGLSNIESIDYTDLAGLVLSPTVERVSSIIDNMSESEVKLALLSVTAFGEQELESIDNPAHFATRLLTAALFKEDRASNASNLGSIDFGSQVESDNTIKEPATRFNAGMDKLYASFSLEEPVEQVFIKWFQNSPYKLKLFNKYTIDKSQSSNYVWYKPKAWNPGLYTVEVYAIDSDLTILASSSFQVSE